MTTQSARVRVAVNGYGVIGKRVADAVANQEDMELVGIADVDAGWRMRIAEQKGFRIFASLDDRTEAMRDRGLQVAGNLDDLLRDAEVVVDCTPKPLGAQNAEYYRAHGVRFIVQGGEKHEVTGHSFVADANYASAVGRESTRVVSCNTTSIVRTLIALKRVGLLKKARGTLMRRATDPWESHEGGIMNTLVPEAKIPSHQAPDAQTVDAELDVVTIAVKVPQTLAHMHSWSIQLTRNSTAEEVIDAFRQSSRIAMIRVDDGLTALNTVKELMADLGRPRDDLYEVALWEDMVAVSEGEAFYAYMVDNQAIVVPDTIDAIRALTSRDQDPQASMSKTDAALGIGSKLV
ncbi:MULTISPECIES: type II glyceraldehyde-3-phosphate dehydrogenase [Mycobacteriaceae]|uniref:Glyceraldehyde-3-phosphate dehydrogenase n=2 Tax=Mycolicibacterium TaxID=1866885 RepID=A0AAW5SIL5_MYCNV|nr:MULTISPECIES: type II glyceraldehyde-3-phosphate dehydrogenase [Mycobacteriaceae]MCV7022912.1 type II glyceraldehyde-3-phosphate dehydrogenase [Mycolicibacterium novocastrense]MCV7058527.1 type II glyceraldehyde-3-phosphate dehydrogenase [Mycolicibacterium gilvum]MDV3134383.1 type II glyceraldehyde-3-phosphate dehydrogenase [Mycobacterium sp. 29Ha]STZ41458.1 glyceraldehyde-3-phosphate dehydrogenase [Mycolicibacterium gilvum]GAT11300.1 glyceraldehyde-3-phosphate dehydrogenase [Mycolicibacter